MTISVCLYSGPAARRLRHGSVDVGEEAERDRGPEQGAGGRTTSGGGHLCGCTGGWGWRRGNSLYPGQLQLQLQNCWFDIITKYMGQRKEQCIRERACFLALFKLIWRCHGNSKVGFSSLLHSIITLAVTVKLLWGKYQRASFMRSQHWYFEGIFIFKCVPVEKKMFAFQLQFHWNMFLRL